MKLTTLLFLFFCFVEIPFLKVLAQNYKNECGSNRYGAVCCAGWMKDNYGQCTVAVCDNDCGRNGKCVAPNLCLCSTGIKSFSCPEENYIGDDVEQCYVKIKRGLCMKGKLNLKLTKEICCSVFNVAWGTPCRRCRPSVCPQGYFYRNGGCKDINECTTIPNVCGNGRCQNTEGSYRCQCDLEYKYDQEKMSCIYFPDYCGKNPDVCGFGGSCVNLQNGKHKCVCSNDYQLNREGTSCVPRYAYAYNFCQFYRGMMCDNGVCVPKGRSYECRCNEGYFLSTDRKSCNRRVDVCKLFHGYLCQNGRCISVAKDFKCECNPGYSPSYDQKKCINLCDLQDPSVCQNGQCIPINNGFKCKCDSGYYLSSDQKSCEKNAFNIGYQNMVAKKSVLKSLPIFDYCADITYRQKCRGGLCTNTETSYKCDCPSGYIAIDQGTSCVTDGYNGNKYNSDQSVNRRSQMKSDCGPYEALCANGRCVKAGSSFRCICDLGYKQALNGKRCIDENECHTKPGICGQGTCVNMPGSYTCSCFNGFTLEVIDDHPICADRNECKEVKNLCSNGVCQNTWGSYKCHCHAGYRPDVSEKHCILKEADYSRKNDRVSGDQLIECPECSYGCEWINSQNYNCKCPPYKVHFDKSRICGDANSVISSRVQFIYNRQKRSAIVFDDETQAFIDAAKTEGRHHVPSHTERLLVEISPNNDQTVNQFISKLSPDSNRIKKLSCSVTVVSANISRIDCSFFVP